MTSLQLSALDWVCFGLLIVGTLNWGIVGVAQLNVLEMALDPVFQSAAANAVARGIYLLIGLAGLYFFYPLYRVSRKDKGRIATVSTD